ncbi:MAG TPA: chitobiase/beta-hexosaminidase C-terminal domain-containing protein [Planctomycetota bacterium]|nr:chitobiase/beta-hexosaminidase C-terminal domain-containing protein [Planctomycetota bacterium]
MLRNLSASAACLLIVLTASANAVERAHPYLYFSASEIAGMRTRFQAAPYATKRTTLINNANAELSSSVSSGTFDIPRTRRALGITGLCAFAYVVTGDVKYATRAKQEVDGLMSASSWTSVQFLATGEACTAAALYYDWCYDTMTETQRATFRTQLLDKGIRPYINAVNTNAWWANNYVSNWSGVVNGGCGLAALAIYDTHADAQTAVNLAWTKIPTFLTGLHEMDGGSHEGVMYYTYGAQFGYYFTTAASRFFGNDKGLFADATSKFAGYWSVYMQGTDNRYANFNNMDESTFENFPPANYEGGPNSGLAALFESKVSGGDQLLTWAADVGGDSWYWKSSSPFWFLWRRNAPSVTKPTLDTTTLFRGSGQAIWRSPSLWFALNGGWTSNQSHYNRDLGTFVLNYNNERLVCDHGYGETDSAQHSTIVLNGTGQLQNVEGSYKRFGTGSNFRYLAVDLSTCYGSGLTKFLRHAVMVNDSYIVLLDDLSGPGTPDFEWRLQTRGTVSAVAAEKRATISRSNKLHVVAAAPSDAAVSMGTLSIDNNSVTRQFVKIRPGVKRANETFVTVLYPTGSTGTNPTASFNTTNGTLSVVRSGGTDSIVFTKDASGKWFLSSVNGVSAAAVGDGSQRTLTPFRGTAPAKVATPTISPNGGSFTGSTSVTLACATTGATIRYTLDGSTPSATSTAYTAALTISSSATLKARAFKSGMTDSDTASAAFTITAPAKVATPTISPNGGSFTGSTSVTLACATTGATIRYTLDGSTPSATSTAYTAALTISSSATLKARAFKSGMTDSDTASAAFTITAPPPAQSVASFTLVNAETGQPISGFDPLPNNATLDLSALPTRKLNIRANTSPATVGSVGFNLDGNANYHTENVAPYFLAGDTGSWTPAVGSHTLSATPYTSSSRGGTAGTTLSISFKVVDPLLVSITAVSSGKTYLMGVAQVGALQYIDRSYTINSLSTQLSGGLLIRQANDDKLLTTTSHLSFTVNQAAIVYVCYDKRATVLPQWLNDGTWTLTTLAISTTDAAASPMKVFSKTVAAGSVTLGANMQPPASGAQTSYIPIIQPASGGAARDSRVRSPEQWKHDGDSDGDGLLDHYELGIGLLPHSVDTDGNGITDEDEAVSGSTDTHFHRQHGLGNGNGPNNPPAPPVEPPGGGETVTPGGETVIPGGEPLAPKRLRITKLTGSVNFAASGRDSLLVAGTIPEVASGFAPAGVTIAVDIGGATATFTLDSKGRARSASGLVALKIKGTRDPQSGKMVFAGGDVPFSLKLSRGNFAAAWSDEGVISADAQKTATDFAVTLRLGSTPYAENVTAAYSAKIGKAGRFTK